MGLSVCDFVHPVSDINRFIMRSFYGVRETEQTCKLSAGRNGTGIWRHPGGMEMQVRARGYETGKGGSGQHKSIQKGDMGDDKVEHLV
jgi:hypothetical protein